MKIESIKNEKNKFETITQIYLLTKNLEEKYKDYKKWFFEKQMPESIDKNSDKRNILYIKSKSKIVAVANLKKYDDEKKICTLYVDKKYRKQGLGEKLVNESLKYLETDTPTFTIDSKELLEFESIINKHNWKITNEVPNMYNKDEEELIINGKTKEDYKVK